MEWSFGIGYFQFNENGVGCDVHEMTVPESGISFRMRLTGWDNLGSEKRIHFRKGAKVVAKFLPIKISEGLRQAGVGSICPDTHSIAAGCIRSASCFRNITL